MYRVSHVKHFPGGATLPGGVKVAFYEQPDGTGLSEPVEREVAERAASIPGYSIVETTEEQEAELAAAQEKAASVTVIAGRSANQADVDQAVAENQRLQAMIHDLQSKGEAAATQALQNAAVTALRAAAEAYGVDVAADADGNAILEQLQTDAKAVLDMKSSHQSLVDENAKLQAENAELWKELDAAGLAEKDEAQPPAQGASGDQASAAADQLALEPAASIADTLAAMANETASKDGSADEKSE